MPYDDAKKLMTGRLVDSLYTEAMLLADEARAYFDEIGRADRDSLAPVDRVSFSCESLKVTTRLMHVIAWLLTHKAIASGEIREEESRLESRRLGDTAATHPDAIEGMPPGARSIIESSIDLYARVARIDHDMIEGDARSPALGLIRRLERAL